MRKPTSLNDVVTLVRESRLIDDETLRVFLESYRALKSIACVSPEHLLSHMVEAQLLTPFQARHLCAGQARGFQLGQYRVLDQLGSGGMGQVFLAEHLALGRLSALKLLHHHIAQDPIIRARFAQEATAAARIDHPNVVRVYDVELESSPPYLVMEYVDGMSLHTLIAHHGPLHYSAAAAIGFQILNGLQAVHLARLVHRDVKPANIILDRKGVAHLSDLGIVRFEDGDLTERISEKMILGTLDYLAPEQAHDSSAVDTRADIFSLGATLYFLLAGSPPLADLSEQKKYMHIHSSLEPVPLCALKGKLPPNLGKVLERMLSRDPASRFRNPAEAADALLPWSKPPEDFPAKIFAHARANERALSNSIPESSSTACFSVMPTVFNRRSSSKPKLRTSPIEHNLEPRKRTILSSGKPDIHE